MGITKYALRKAKRKIGVESFKKGGNFGGEKGWYLRLPLTEKVETTAEEVENSENRHLQANQSDKTGYNNNLTEDVEGQKNKHLQQVHAARSTEESSGWRVTAVCKCGAEGFAGERCLNCKETIVPF